MPTEPFTLAPADQAHLRLIMSRAYRQARPRTAATPCWAYLTRHCRCPAGQSATRRALAGCVSGLRLASTGREAALGQPVRIDGKQRARIPALAGSTPPEGHDRWTLRLLVDKAVALGYCTSLSHTGAGKILKKTNSNRT